MLKKGKEEPEFLRHGIKGCQKKGRLPLSSLVFQFHTPAAQKAREEKLLLPLLSFFFVSFLSRRKGIKFSPILLQSCSSIGKGKGKKVDGEKDSISAFAEGRRTARGTVAGCIRRPDIKKRAEKNEENNSSLCCCSFSSFGQLFVRASSCSFCVPSWGYLKTMQKGTNLFIHIVRISIVYLL